MNINIRYVSYKNTHLTFFLRVSLVPLGEEPNTLLLFVNPYSRIKGIFTVGPTKYPWRKILDPRNIGPTKKYFGLMKYPRDKILYLQRYKDTMAEDPRNLVYLL